MPSIAEWALRLGALFRGQPAESDEFREWLADACEWTHNREDLLKSAFTLGSYERYDWYQERGVIIFSHGGVPKVVADIQIAGTISKTTKTWLWAWANATIEEPVSRAAEHVRHIGAERGFAKLTIPRWRAGETDGWEMTSIQAKVVGAEGVYRSPDEKGFTFMTLSNVRWAATDEWYVPAPEGK